MLDDTTFEDTIDMPLSQEAAGTNDFDEVFLEEFNRKYMRRLHETDIDDHRVTWQDADVVMVEVVLSWSPIGDPAGAGRLERDRWERRTPPALSVEIDRHSGRASVEADWEHC